MHIPVYNSGIRQGEKGIYVSYCKSLTEIHSIYYIKALRNVPDQTVEQSWQHIHCIIPT